MNGVYVPLAQRWFRVLLLIAILAMAGLPQMMSTRSCKYGL